MARIRLGKSHSGTYEFERTRDVVEMSELRFPDGTEKCERVLE